VGRYAALAHGIACSLRHFVMLIVGGSLATFERKNPSLLPRVGLKQWLDYCWRIT